MHLMKTTHKVFKCAYRYEPWFAFIMQLSNKPFLMLNICRICMYVRRWEFIKDCLKKRKHAFNQEKKQENKTSLKILLLCLFLNTQDKKSYKLDAGHFLRTNNRMVGKILKIQRKLQLFGTPSLINSMNKMQDDCVMHFKVQTTYF